MQRTASAALVALALLVPHGRAQETPPVVPPPAALRDLEARGFAVDATADARLLSRYRHPGRCAIFVSSDAALAAYLLLERRAQDDAAFVEDPLLSRDAAAWDAAVREAAPGSAGRCARYFTAVLAALAEARTPEPDADVREAVDRDLAWLRGALRKSPVLAVLETSFDIPRFEALRRGAPSPEQARRDACAHWITRVRLPDSDEGVACRRTLTATLPAALRERLVRDFARAGTATLRHPGRSGVFDVEPVENARFPPGILVTYPDSPGLDRGARLGSRLAAELLAARSPSTVLPDPEPGPRPGSTAFALDSLLWTTLRPADERWPAPFRSTAWQALALQSALAVDALHRRALGPLHEPTRVFALEPLPGFVHPDPAFWEELANLARTCAEALIAMGDPRPSPSRESLEAAITALESCVADGSTLPEEHLWTLRRWKVNSIDVATVATLGAKGEPAERIGKVASWVRDYVIPQLRRRLSSLSDQPSEASREFHHRRSTRGMLERLAAIAVRGASLAKAQASGVEPEGLAEFLADFGFLCEDAEGHSAESNLHRGAAVVLLDFPRQLVHGSAGLQDLWVRFPWKGRHVDARGVVFGFRAWVGLEAPDDAAWARLVERGEASPPSWASAASGAAPRPGK